MKTIFTRTAMAMSLLVIAAQANVSLTSASYQEMTKVTPNGEKLTEWVKATKVVPGTVIRYVNSVNNAGEKTATSLEIKNPIPENMVYVANTAICQSACTVTYSVDGGQTFKEASELFVGVGQERHMAQASEYTDVRWVIDSLVAVSQSAVEYKARLK